MKYLYHGSVNPDIEVLEARSLLHSSQQKVIYLTDNIPYALYYIWDAEKIGYSGKHVTGWLKDGVAFYEEQFLGQLEAFYSGVSGYLYCVNAENAKTVEGREGLFYSTEDLPIEKKCFIADVYQELLKYEAMGEFKVKRFIEQTSERQTELIDLIAQAIKRENCYADDKEHQEFMKKYFSESWEKAVNG